jgi:hypothetical protein
LSLACPGKRWFLFLTRKPEREEEEEEEEEEDNR